MTSSRSLLIKLIEQGALAPEDVEAALDVMQIRPDASAWRNFIDHLLLWIGGLALAFAALFFIAHNWGEIGRFAKFGLLQASVALATIIYWKLGPNSAIAKVSLLVAAILLGVLLAFFGQTYQTGADPWQLFFYWALLILPWALIGRFAAIWILWVLLINLSLVLHHQVAPGLFSFVGNPELGLVWQLFIFNTIALAAWELAARTWSDLSARWATGLLAVWGGVPITWVVLYAIFDERIHGVPVGMAWVCWSLWLAVMYRVYRRLRPDLFMLAGCCLSGIVVLTGFAGSHLIDAGDDVLATASLLLGLLILGLGAASAAWLKKVHREWQS